MCMNALSLLNCTLFASCFALGMSLQAQSIAAPTTLGLSRLKNTARANGVLPLAAGKFSVDDLSTRGTAGASKTRRNNVDYLALDSGREWSRPIRGNARDVTFVSFQVCASQTTIIDIGGARLGVTAGPMTNGLQLMFDDSATGALQWRSLNYHVATDKYDGKNFAALPTITVRLDPGAGTWDIYSGSSLLADNLPLIDAKKNDRRFTVRAGTEGAWVLGLVLADENPLYEDVNNNAIDDAFERQQFGGSLLATSASKADRQLVAQQWRQAQMKKPPAALLAFRPLSDKAAQKKGMGR